MIRYLLVVAMITFSLTGFTVTAFAGPMDDLLLKSIHNRDMKMVDAAIQNGANVNFNTNTDSPLIAAIATNNTALVKHLLKLGADPNVKVSLYDITAKTPLIQAVLYAKQKQGPFNYNIAQQLLDAGANINDGNEKGSSPLSIAIYGTPDLNIIKFLISSGANVNHSSNHGFTPLMETTVNFGSTIAIPNKIAAAKMLLQAGADPSLVDNSGKTALQHAINSNFAEMINLLLPISPK